MQRLPTLSCNWDVLSDDTRTSCTNGGRNTIKKDVKQKGAKHAALADAGPFIPWLRQRAINQYSRTGCTEKVIQNPPRGACDTDSSELDADGISPCYIERFAHINKSTEGAFAGTEAQRFDEGIDLFLGAPPEASLALINARVHMREETFQRPRGRNRAG